MFAKIDKYDDKNNSITAIPLVSNEGLELPPLVNVPLLTFGNKNYNIKFPIVRGSIVLIIFLDYDSDNLLLDGETLESNTNRTHSLNDAIALPFIFNPLNNNGGGSDIFEINSGKGVKINAGGDITFAAGGINLGVIGLVEILNDHETRILALEDKIKDMNL